MKKIVLILVGIVAFASQVVGAQAATTINVEATLTPGQQYVVEFTTPEAIDLSQPTDNITITYYYEYSDGTKTPIINKTTQQALVKDKTWDGFLWDKNLRTNYSKGTANNSAYADVIPANSVLQTMINPAHNSTMDYVSPDWANGKIIAEITITTATNDYVGSATDGTAIANPNPAPVAKPAETPKNVKANPATGDIDMNKTIVMIGASIVLLGAAAFVLKKQISKN